MITLSALALCAQQLLGTTIYVSPTGLDTNGGTSTAPYKTIAKAVSVVHQRTSSTIPATIRLGAGDYLLSSQVYIDSTDSNLTIVGAGARILGSTILKTWTALGTDSYASTFPVAAQPYILVADLNSQISSSALTTLKSTNNTMSMDVLEDGQPLAIAQFPAAGTWLKTSNKTTGTTIGWSSSVPKTWTGVTNVWMSGYPSYDYAYQNAQLTSVNVSAMTAQLPSSVTASPGCRFQFLNVPQSLSAPGQYYLNRSTMKLYFWPTSSSFKELAINTCSNPLFDIADGAANVQFISLAMQGGLSSAIYAHQSSFITINNCVVNGCSAMPLDTGACCCLYFDGCSNCKVINSTISNCGALAISMNGGALAQPSGHLISNNTISNYGRLNRNSPALILYGGGTIVTHNLIQNGAFDAIDLYGPSYKITNNIINNVDYEVSDSGAIYEGRQPLARGLTIQNNLFTNVKLNFVPNSQTAAQIAQVYLDDMQPGATVQGNIFEGGGYGLIVGGGRDNTVTYNVFLGDSLGIQLDARGTSWAYADCTFGGDWGYMDSLQAELLDVPVFLTTFPLVSDALTNQPYFPVRFNSSYNVYAGSKFIDYQDNTGTNNTTCLSNVILSSASLPVALASVPKGYQMPSLAQIGPQPYNNPFH